MVTRSKNWVEMIVDCDAFDDDGIVFKFGFEDVFDGQDFICYLTTTSGDFYKEQEGIFQKIGRRIKLAWYMLTGKEYRFKEICMTRASFEEFAKMIGEYWGVLDGGDIVQL